MTATLVADEMSAWLADDGRSITFVAWSREQPFVSSLLHLPMQIAPRFFLDEEWCAVADTVNWFGADGEPVPTPRLAGSSLHS